MIRLWSTGTQSIKPGTSRCAQTCRWATSSRSKTRCLPTAWSSTPSTTRKTSSCAPTNSTAKQTGNRSEPSAPPSIWWKWTTTTKDANRSSTRRTCRSTALSAKNLPLEYRTSAEGWLSWLWKGKPNTKVWTSTTACGPTARWPQARWKPWWSRPAAKPKCRWTWPAPDSSWAKSITKSTCSWRSQSHSWFSSDSSWWSAKASPSTPPSFSVGKFCFSATWSPFQLK